MSKASVKCSKKYIITDFSVRPGRCRKQRSKCSRTRPECEQCLAADIPCQYLDGPGDLESTALRDRFSGLEEQIQSLMDEFGLIEQLVAENKSTGLRTDALNAWDIRKYRNGAGLCIETNMAHVEEIYSCIVRFALDNAVPPPSSYPSSPTYSVVATPIWLTRNNAIFTTIKLSHFTSLLPPEPSLGEEDYGADYSQIPPILPTDVVLSLLNLYKTCLLHGGIQYFDELFAEELLTRPLASAQPSLQLLFASMICHMLPHAYVWHPHVFGSLEMTKEACTQLAQQYYRWAKHLLSTLFFDAPSLTTCHAISNLVLYHVENGNTDMIYIYAGMAIRMASALRLYREDALGSIARAQIGMMPIPGLTVANVTRYARALLWFMYFLDTNVSHFRNKPYEIDIDDHFSTTTCFNPFGDDDEHQNLFQWFEFKAYQITRTIRRVCFANDTQQVPYKEIERIEKSLLTFRESLPPLEHIVDDTAYSVWRSRCLYMHWIKYHGHWILLHQTYLPTPISVERCTTAAFALVDLFNTWVTQIDCYFRPCVHELKQACEVLLYHVDSNTALKDRSLTCLSQLMDVIFKTPVRDIARTRPFVLRVQKTLAQNGYAHKEYTQA
ncbi:hypothetical protein EC973_005566 [Apophysomyces ossiformis]|uniref:Zn(2)-C6 fungal-type domain-containing protein n=1 Tax=Apophysomyces ossiformis TaxID=679940 RepID=A0A8H7BP82_9FUNG|nr:hypothetical protein EC973_005566 [Apophysomyces ossiformis]